MLLLALAAGCDSGGTAPPPSTATELVTDRRAWAPLERAAMLERIVRLRQWTFPYVGDLSDFAAFLVPADSAPELATSTGAGSGLSAAGVDLMLIEEDTLARTSDTLNLLGWIWWGMSDSTRAGFVFIQTRNATAESVVVNSVEFDSTGIGAGGGERRGTATWRAEGWTRRNTATVASNLGVGGVTTVTSGPFTGGSMRQALMTGLLDSVRLDVQTAGAPPVLYASMTFRSTPALRLLFTTRTSAP